MILQSLAGLPAFLLYFCTALIVVVAYLFVYTRVTPHPRVKILRTARFGVGLCADAEHGAQRGERWQKHPVVCRPRAGWGNRV